MGFFGGDNEPDNRANDLIEKQMMDNQAEIEQKRRSLYQTRLDVIKSQGAQQWSSPTFGDGQGLTKPQGGVVNRLMGHAIDLQSEISKGMSGKQ